MAPCLCAGASGARVGFKAFAPSSCPSPFRQRCGGGRAPRIRAHLFLSAAIKRLLISCYSWVGPQGGPGGAEPLMEFARKGQKTLQAAEHHSGGREHRHPPTPSTPLLSLCFADHFIFGGSTLLVSLKRRGRAAEKTSLFLHSHAHRHVLDAAAWMLPPPRALPASQCCCVSPSDDGSGGRRVRHI